MRMMILAAVLAALTESAYGHGWVTAVKSTNPTDPHNPLPGMARNYPKEGVDSKMVNQISQKDLNKAVCLATKRGEQSFPQEFPVFTGAPGDWIYLYWRDNGHITKDPENEELVKKHPDAKNGHIWVYASDKIDGDGAGNPLLSAIHDKWKKDGSLDKGMLLGETDYDDGHCAEVNESLVFERRCIKGFGGECKLAVQIPKDAKPDTFITMIWVWDFSQKEGANGPAQWYTSCVDIKIRSGAPIAPEPPKLPPKVPTPTPEEYAKRKDELQKWKNSGAKPQDRPGVKEMLPHKTCHASPVLAGLVKARMKRDLPMSSAKFR